jgi:hypothetical protein
MVDRILHAEDALIIEYYHKKYIANKWLP